MIEETIFDAPERDKSNIFLSALLSKMFKLETAWNKKSDKSAVWFTSDC